MVGAVVAGPEGTDRVVLDAITYDDDGGVLLAGRASEQGSVQIYLDNAPLATGTVAEGGDWRLTLPTVDPGTYTLRVDQLSADGRVVSRVETPFRREVAADMAALARNDADLRVATTVVQPGSTLWAIARDAFGDGMMYVAVFEANAGQIRDPDLIYPGQVFVVPDAQDAVQRP
jgi:nucleoid-associated protein YgaU